MAAVPHRPASLRKMRKKRQQTPGAAGGPSQEGFMELVRAIVAGDVEKGRAPARRFTTPGACARRGRREHGKPRSLISSKRSNTISMPETRRCTWRRRGLLSREICQDLIERGADCAAANRRGAQPLHYAADANTWNPDAQAATIDCLIRAGADPNATDKNGVNAAALGGAHPMCRGRPGAVGRWCESAEPEPQRLHAAPSRGSKYRPRRQRHAARHRAAAADHTSLVAGRRGAERQGWAGQGRA